MNRLSFAILVILAASWWAAGKFIDLVLCPVRKIKQPGKKEEPFYWD